MALNANYMECMVETIVLMSVLMHFTVNTIVSEQQQFIKTIVLSSYW